MPFSFSSVSSLSSEDNGTHEWHPSTNIWGCTLSKDKPSVTWSFFGRNDECHTLILKQAVLGVKALPGERNVIEVETKGYHEETICQPIMSLTLGKIDMCIMDITFDANKPVKFSLTSGTGPVHICAQHEVDYDDESDEDETFDDGTAKARENRRHTIATSKPITRVTSTTAKSRTAVAKKLTGNTIQKKKPPAAKSIAKQAGKITPSKKKSSSKGAAKKALPAVKKATAVTSKNKAQPDNDVKLTTGAAAANSRRNSCSAGICHLK